jgi:DNA-binding transcriptional ArsR family regulator
MSRPDPLSSYELDDARALRAMAHPLRARLLGELRLRGAATASELGRRLGESSGATSYHLRQLERFGFVAESQDQPSRRERVWQALHASTRLDPSRFTGAGTGDLDDFTAMRLGRLVELVESWPAEREHWSPEWVSASGLSDAVARLSPEATRRLHDGLGDLLDRLEKESADAEETAWVTVHLHSVPRRDEEAAS